LFQQYSVHWAH